MSTTLTIASREIRVRDGRYCLNDLHRASGAQARHQPANFLRLESTKALIQEIEQYPDVGNDQSSDMRIDAIATKRGGRGPGTYACRELVYAYAMWISPKFHLHVIRAFDAMQQRQLPPQPAQALQDQLIHLAINQHYRWLVSIRDDGGFAVTPVPGNCMVISPDDEMALRTLLREYVPAKLVPMIADIGMDRLKKLATMRAV